MKGKVKLSLCLAGCHVMGCTLYLAELHVMGMGGEWRCGSMDSWTWHEIRGWSA